MKIIRFLCCLLVFFGCKGIYAPHFVFAEIGGSYQGVTAHQGNSSQYPGNTIPAFQSALALHVDWVELDVHLTTDGKVVVIHDDHTGNVGDRNLVVAQHTYDELKEVDVASAFREKNGLSLVDCPKGTIPLLEDVLLLVNEQTRSKISIQPKMDCIEEVMDIIDKMDKRHLVGFNDGSLALMAKVKSIAPDIPVFWDRPADFVVKDDIVTAHTHGFEALIINDNGITEEKVAKVKAAGLEVGAWTINHFGRMKELLDMGLDRIYTDFPEDLIALKYKSASVLCEGEYPEHLQGVCKSEDCFYWSWTTFLVKTDRRGRLLHRVKVDSHHGDLCYQDGKLFVAVNLGEFNSPAGTAESWIYEYDANTLKELARYRVPELIYGAGGIGFYNGRFFVVGGLPAGMNANFVYEYNDKLQFIAKHELSTGYTWRGIQTISNAGNRWWAGIYGTSGNNGYLLQLDQDFGVVNKVDANASLGVLPFTPNTLLIASNKRLASGGPFRGKLTLYVIDENELYPIVN